MNTRSKISPTPVCSRAFLAASATTTLYDSPLIMSCQRPSWNVRAVLVLPDRQAPLLEQVHGRIHVARDVGHQVLARDAHQVVAHVVDVVLDGVRAVPQAHVLVDGREAHGHGAGAVHGGLVHQGDLQAVLLGPVGRFYGRAAGGHAAAEDQQIGFNYNILKIGHLSFLSPTSSG